MKKKKKKNVCERFLTEFARLCIFEACMVTRRALLPCVVMRCSG